MQKTMDSNTGGCAGAPPSSPRLGAPIFHESEISLVARSPLAALAGEFPPHCRVDCGETRVAFGGEIDFSEVEAAGAGDGLGVDFAAARHDDLLDARRP